MEVQGVQIIVLSIIAVVCGGALTWLFLKPDPPTPDHLDSTPEKEPPQEIVSAHKPEEKHSEPPSKVLDEPCHKKTAAGKFWIVILVRIPLSVICVGIMLFSCFGFLCTFEPMDRSVQITWRLIYALSLILSGAGLVLLNRSGSKKT